MIVQPDPYAPETVALYRLYNHCGALLYVGISRHPKDRFQQHAAEKPWWRYVEHWAVEWHPDRAAALAAEATAIVTESPAFNANGVCTVPPPSCLDLWRQRLESKSARLPKALDLTELFIAYMRIATLPPGARSAWTAEEAERVYRLARQRAGVMGRLLHRSFLRWREECRVAQNRAAQRAHRARARVSGQQARHTPSLVLERPI